MYYWSFLKNVEYIYIGIIAVYHEHIQTTMDLTLISNLWKNNSSNYFIVSLVLYNTIREQRKIDRDKFHI